MNHLGIALLFLSLFPLSVYNSTNLGYLCKTEQKLISEYLNDPILTFGSINQHARRNQCDLELFVKWRFDIPDIFSGDFDRNDPEFHHVLSLSAFSNNPDYLFRALLEDVIKRKKPYNSLYAPLASYVARRFKTLSQDELLSYYESEEYSVEFHLFLHYQANGQYKSASELFQNNPTELIFLFNENYKNPNFFEIFKENPQFVQILKAAFVPNDEDFLFAFADRQPMKIRWIFQNILCNSPEYFYTDLLDQEPTLITKALMDFDLLFIEVPESEKPRVYFQFKKILNQYSIGNEEEEIILCHLINEIRYGLETISVTSLSEFNSQNILKFSKVALLSKNKDIFHQIYNAKEDAFIQNIEKIYFFGRLEELMVVSEILTCASGQVQAEILSDPKFLQLATNYYAVRSIKFENSQIFVYLVAPESSLNYGLLPFIQFTSKPIGMFDERGINRIWSKMKIIDEETFYSFLCDYQKLPIINKKIEGSHEIIEFILKSTILIEKIKEIGIKFVIDKNIVKFMELIETAEGKQIFDFHYIKDSNITLMRNKNKLKLFEELLGKSVAEIFLKQDYGNMTEIDYFKWRLALNYWMKGDQRNRIAQIRSPAIIKMLRFDFYDEIIELVDNAPNNLGW
jgi:hypothetical protein